MNNRMLNDHGQPFSKKQKKASWTMMAIRKGGFQMKNPMSPEQKMKNAVERKSMMNLIKGMFRRKAS